MRTGACGAIRARVRSMHFAMRTDMAGISTRPFRAVAARCVGESRCGDHCSGDDRTDRTARRRMAHRHRAWFRGHDDRRDDGDRRRRPRRSDCAAGPTPHSGNAVTCSAPPRPRVNRPPFSNTITAHAFPESRQTEIGIVREHVAFAKVAAARVAAFRRRSDGRAAEARHWEAVAARSC